MCVDGGAQENSLQVYVEIAGEVEGIFPATGPYTLNSEQ